MTAPHTAATDASGRRPARSWPVIRAIIAKDLIAVRRSKAVVIPMIAVPALLMIVLPLLVGLAARAADHPDVGRILNSMPGDLARPILSLPAREQLIVLVNGYLLAPLFLIVPLMVSAVLAADAFAGEKERKTLESLLHLPIAERDLFLAKLLTAFIPAIAVSWIGFIAFCLVSNGVAWPVLHRVFVPTQLWMVMILWIGPAVATLGLAVMVRVSVRARTSQEANQLGGAVILPLIFLSVGQSSGVLLAPIPVAVGIGAVIWVIALWLVRGGAKRFTRDQLAARV